MVGQIDLSTLNQSTRPKKKTKEEKRKEWEEKDKVRQDQKNRIKEAIMKEIRKDEKPVIKQEDKPVVATDTGAKKKRNRINKDKEKVNINTVSFPTTFTRPILNSEKANYKGGQGQGNNKSRTNSP
ncbi:hypothetical protein EZS27_043301, partial [termite gut metagenome]